MAEKLVELRYVGAVYDSAGREIHRRYIAGVPSRDITVALPGASEAQRDAADLIVDTQAALDALVWRMKGDYVLDEHGDRVPTGLYEYAESAPAAPADDEEGES